MIDPGYYLTGINRLTGTREILTPKLSRAMADKMLLEYQSRNHGRRNLPYRAVRIDSYTAVQQTIKFGDYD